MSKEKDMVRDYVGIPLLCEEGFVTYAAGKRSRELTRFSI